MRSLFLLAFVLVACGAEPLPITSCTAGVQTACTCPGGSTGAQRCAADGSGFGECMCSSADAAVDVVAVADAQPDAPTPDMVTVDRPDVVAVGDGPVVDVPPACGDRDGDGYGAGCARGPDCDDNDPLSHPGAPERCDGFDNDCDGNADTLPSTALNAGCVTEGATILATVGRWETPACVQRPGTDHPVAGYERFTRIVCRVCRSEALTDGGSRRICGCYVDSRASWLCD